MTSVPFLWRRSPWASLFLALAILVFFPARAPAQEAIRVEMLEPEIHFAEQIVFRLRAEADHPIRTVQIFYREAGERVRARATPEFTPGRQIEAVYTWELHPGDLAPGTQIEYRWHLEDDTGQAVDTEVQTLVYEDDRFPWQEISSGNLTLHWYDAREDQAQRLLDAAVAALERLQNAVGIELSQPVHIYAYQTREDMKLALPSRSEGFDERVVTLGLTMSDDTLLVLASAPDVEMVTAHELSHIVVGLATRNPLGGLPRWLDEGLAMYAEGKLPTANRIALEQALRKNHLISVRSLSAYTGDPEQVDLYYAEVYSVVDFLLKEYGRDRMHELLQLFREGTYQEDALREVYGLTLDELDAAWRDSIDAPPRQSAVPSPEGQTALPSSEEEPPSRKAQGGGLCAGALLPAAMVIFSALRVKSRRRQG